jgi:predicted site-specific integrase-resolvase
MPEYPLPIKKWILNGTAVTTITGLCLLQGWVIAKEITEIGSGLNGKRKKLLILKMLQDEIILNLEFWWNAEIA